MAIATSVANTYCGGMALPMQDDSDFGEELSWTLGDRLAKARAQRKLKQEDMARLLGLGRHTIMRYERDETTPSLAVIRAWASVTRIKLRELLPDVDEDGVTTCYYPNGGFPMSLDGVVYARCVDSLKELEPKGAARPIQRVA